MMAGDILTTLKILIIGETNVGKSNLLLRFIKDNYNPKSTTTLGIDIQTKWLPVGEKIVKLSIWDTAGQERFRSLTPSYYRDAQGVILVFDVNDYASFAKLEMWVNELETYPTKSNIVKMVVGNKIDKKNCKVLKEEIEKFTEKYQTLYAEASAKTNDGVALVFEKLVQKIIQTPGLWEPYTDRNILISERKHQVQSCFNCCKERWENLKGSFIRRSSGTPNSHVQQTYSFTTPETNANIEEQRNPDELFLLSNLREMERMSDSQKRQFKISVLSTVDNILNDKTS